MANGIYEGRLEADGYGNLLASEGEWKGHPVAYHDGSYVFIQPGEPSHNERHELAVKEVAMTQAEDPAAPHYAGTGPDDAPEGTEHHWAVLENDPHYDAEAPNLTRIRQGADAQEVVATSHTAAYKDA